MKHLASYLELVAHLDTDKLATTGYDLRRDVVRGIHGGTLPATDKFWAELGPKSGECVLHVAQGDPSVEENWKLAITSATGSHILLEGLIPAQTYWFRIRAHGSGGPGLWTDPVSLIVV